MLFHALKLWLLLTLIREKTSLIDISACGKSKGCWFIPPQCETNNTAEGSSSTSNCDSVVTWNTIPRIGLMLELEASLSDISPLPFRGRYVALGYSKDDRMGDDIVIECVAKPDSTVSAYVSFNDATSNFRLNEASKLMLKNISGSVIDGRLSCEIIWTFHLHPRIPQSDKFKIFDLQNGSYVLQIARGRTKSGDNYELGIHSTDDGPLFPWISSERVNSNEVKVVKNMKQTDIPRFVQYNLVKVHGIFMIFGWWVFGSIAALFARFTKGSWPETKIFGIAIWFQLHRCFMIISVFLQAVAFAFVFIQAGDFKVCSYSCDAYSYALKCHTILGVTCTAAALLQPFIAWARPKPSSPIRPVFNWFHWFIGTGSWIIASVTIFLSAPLGKSGLRRNFGYKPDYIMAGYICSFIVTSILLEILAVYYYSAEIDETSARPMTLFNVPKKVMPESSMKNKRLDKYQIMVLVLFTIVSLSLCIALSVLIALNKLI